MDSTYIISALIFAISTNIDCLAVGLSYGIKAIHIDIKNNILISMIAISGTYVSMKIGSVITQYISISWANLIGSFILVGIGGIMVYQFILEKFSKKKTMNLKDYDTDASGTINGKETVALAIGLTINNMGLGIGASITGTPILLSCIFTFILSIFFINVSQYLGKTFLSRYVNNYASLVSGILIIVLGICEFLL